MTEKMLLFLINSYITRKDARHRASEVHHRRFLRKPRRVKFFLCAMDVRNGGRARMEVRNGSHARMEVRNGIIFAGLSSCSVH